MNDNTELLKQPFKIVRELLEWRAANGMYTTIDELEDTHIKNIIIMLDGKQKACDELELGEYEYAGCTAREWIAVMRNELLHRVKQFEQPKQLVKVTL